jgi:NAD(P)-dependent dehydrogenase (short-subunit alcohol dehydrogenase family)
MAGAQKLVDQAVERFGRLDALINNAGVLRDRMFVNMSEDEWDSCIRGHLKAAFCPTRIAAAHWRDLFKAGEAVQAAVVSTSSTSGLIGQAGQSNYGAAKAGIAAMTVILAEELGRYGVRANAITPVARTRMTEETPGVADLVKRPEDPAAFDVYNPANVSPLIAWLISAECPATGKVFYVKGGEVRQFLPWHYGKQIDGGDRWSVAELAEAVTPLL